MNADERGGRTLELEHQLVRTVDGHVDSLDGHDAGMIACSAVMATLVSVALRSTNFELDRAHEMLRNAPWRELLESELDDMRERGEVEHARARDR